MLGLTYPGGDGTSQLRPQDPTLVVRSALADAASVASLMTTTECVAWSLVALVPPKQRGLRGWFAGEYAELTLGRCFIHPWTIMIALGWVAPTQLNMTSSSTKGPKCP